MSLLLEPGRWLNGALPGNVRVGPDSVLQGEDLFKRFCSQVDPALVIGAHCTMDGVHFALGERAKVVIGDYCYFTNALLLSELELHIGDYVAIGWNAAITDTDFHPIAPAERIADALALSPLGKNCPRPPVVRRPVVIEDGVFIGPNAAIMKGVRLGAGAFIEPGAVVTRDVPPRARVLGNPAQVIGEV